MVRPDAKGSIDDVMGEVAAKVGGDDVVGCREGGRGPRLAAASVKAVDLLGDAEVDFRPVLGCCCCCCC